VYIEIENNEICRNKLNKENSVEENEVKISKGKRKVVLILIYL
jgi:hypothetical protein